MRGFNRTRRDCLRAAALAAVGAALPWPLQALAQAAAERSLLTRAIPGSGERLPIIGLGASSFSVSSPADLAQRREVIAALAKLPGAVVDTAQAHGLSEQVLGRLVAELGVRDRLFIASKMPSGGQTGPAGELLQRSFDNLQVERIDLMQVHNLYRAADFIPELLRAKEAGRVRYVGVSASVQQYPALVTALRQYPLDFVQLDFSLAVRELAQRVLDTARERRAAVLAGAPFGGRVRAGTMFSLLAGRPLPEWAAEIDAGSWAQVLLKYAASHPAVTAVLPGTSRMRHLQDNLEAAYGRLPDADLRARIEQYWDAVRNE
ncbi:MAG TPA: aldo/keto reductase [Arenimonas sp.]|nr:aldo/keto reductase [Arenimonas sp.]